MTESNLRKLGKTEFEVFPLGFGGIPIQRLSEKKAVKVIQAAVNKGINFIDTARAYSDSEAKIGTALQKIDEKIYLATKTPADDKESALADVNKSLKLLGVDKIDIYQLHGVNDQKTFTNTMKPGGAFDGLKQAQKEGKIKYIGITGHSTEILLKALKTGKFATVQFCYNFIENKCEEELIDYAQKHNIGMIAMKPLAGGMLHNAPIALKYILSQKGVIPIPGIETIEEINENVAVTKNSWELSPEEQKIMKQLKEELGTVFCRRCEYCQPCPEEIPIPIALRAQSFINRMPVDQLLDEEGWIYSAFQKADECTECKQCIEKCPYDLAIPKLLKENKKIMDQFYSSHN